MKILATFDGSQCSEAILPQLEMMAHMPNAEFTFLLVAVKPREVARRGPLATPVVAGLGAPGGTPILVTPTDDIDYIEDLGEALERTIAERRDYLSDLVAQMPEGPAYSVDVRIDSHPATAIIQYAMETQPDVIVMGTHGTTGMIHRLFGDVAEEVVRSGVAPVLLVHPNAARHSTAGVRDARPLPAASH